MPYNLLLYPVFAGGILPYDGVPTNETVSVAVEITVIYTLMTAVGIAFAFMCLGFNIAFRNTK